MSAPTVVLVQAIDGRWDYGPQKLVGVMEIDEFGTYESREDAERAARAAGLKVERA